MLTVDDDARTVPDVLSYNLAFAYLGELLRHSTFTLHAVQFIVLVPIPVVKDNYGIRRLTIRECLRFQGFPESFNISRDNSIEDAYKQIGNSVCVPIVNRIAIEIAKVLERKLL